MKKRNRIFVALSLIVVAAIIFVAYFFLFSPADNLNADAESLSAPPAPAQKNIAWQREEKSLKMKATEPGGDLLIKLRGGIFVRSEENKDDNLLVKFTEPAQEFYRYDGDKNTIDAISEKEWLGGKNEISCREREYNAREILDIDESPKTLYVRNAGQISAFGRYALDLLESPRHKLAIVLSANGPRTKGSPGLIFGGQSGEIHGRRYVQILRLADRTYITEPVGLNAVNKVPHYWFCWVDSEKFVLAYEVEYTNTNRFEINFHVIKTTR